MATDVKQIERFSFICELPRDQDILTKVKENQKKWKSDKSETIRRMLREHAEQVGNGKPRYVLNPETQRLIDVLIALMGEQEFRVLLLNDIQGNLPGG